MATIYYHWDKSKMIKKSSQKYYSEMNKLQRRYNVCKWFFISSMLANISFILWNFIK